MSAFRIARASRKKEKEGRGKKRKLRGQPHIIAADKKI